MALIGEVSVAITGDTSALQAATRKGSEEMRQFARDALQSKRVIESLETPTQTYARKLAELTRLQQAGHLSTEQFSQAQSKLQQELRRTVQASDQAKTSTEKLNDETKDSFGQSVVSALGSYAAGLSAIGSAAGLARAAIEAVNREAERGVRGIQGNLEGDINLAQIGKLTDEDKSRIDEAAARTSVTRSEARQTFFDLQSAGVPELFEDVVRSQQLLGSQAALASGSFARNFPELSGLQSASALLTASQASDVNFEGLTQTSFRAGVGARSIGASAASTLGTLSALSNRLGDPSQSARLLEQFGLKAGQAGLQGEFLDVVSQLQADDTLRADFIKDNTELLKVYNELSNPDVRAAVESTSAAVAKDIGGGGQLLQSRLSALEVDENFRANRRAEAAREERERQAEGLGRTRLTVGAIRDETAAAELRRGGLVGNDFLFDAGVQLRATASALGGGRLPTNQDVIAAAERQKEATVGEKQIVGVLERISETLTNPADEQEIVSLR